MAYAMRIPRDVVASLDRPAPTPLAVSTAMTARQTSRY
jgi:hypothetical protein